MGSTKMPPKASWNITTWANTSIDINITYTDIWTSKFSTEHSEQQAKVMGTATTKY
jgi:hypothetical protein